MKLLGITLRRPDFNEVTAASVMALGLWLLLLGIANAAGQLPDRAESCALLLVTWWGCVGVRCGINLSAGLHHWTANALIAAVLIGANDVAWRTMV